MKTIQLLSLFIIIVGILSCNKEQSFYVAKTSFTIQNTQAYVDSLVQFTNTSDSNHVTYSWDFGDGVTSDLKNPSHSYANRGQFTITLKTYVNKTFSNSVSQNISVQIGEKYYSLKKITEGFDFAEGIDSSIFVIGQTQDTQESQMFLSKFDKNLRFSWIKYLDNSLNPYVGNIERTADGNFLISGSINNSANANHFALSKIDTQGNVIWDNKYDQTNGQCIFATEAKDGGIISIGSEETGYVPIVTVLKTDREGHFQWKKNFTKEWLMFANNIIPLNDGYLFASSTRGQYSATNSCDSLVITKLNLSGEVVWKKSKEWQYYYYIVYTVFSSTIAINDKGIVVVNDGNNFVMVFDLAGNFIKRNFSEIEQNTLITTTTNNKFVIAGQDNGRQTTSVNFFNNIGDRIDSRSYGSHNRNCQPTRGNGSALKPLLGGNLLFMGIRYKECMETNIGSTLLVKINQNGDIQ
jgi:PKD repeat protein